MSNNIKKRLDQWQQQPFVAMILHHLVYMFRDINEFYK